MLPVLKQQANQYEAWTEAAAKPGGNLTVTEMAVYRMQAGGVELLKPLLIWLHEPGRGLPGEVVDRIVGAAESWVVRRQLLRLPGSALGRVVADIVKAHSGAPVGELADRVVGHLSRLDVTTTYWPGDDEVRSVLATEAVYRRYPRARLRSFLEAIENSLRAETRSPQVERIGLPIEHVLPQKWSENWPVEGPDEEHRRQSHVHRLGNLTLLTGSLNSKVSNGSWAVKRKALLAHNTIKLTGRLVELTESRQWDEELIEARTAMLLETLLRVWPVPPDHQGLVVDPQTKDPDWIEIRHLVGAGLIAPGTAIQATHRDFKGVPAVIAKDGYVELDGRRFYSPSGAAKHLRKRATNGWYFWALEDGRRLKDVRSEFLGAKQAGNQQLE